jgi:Transglutaminase-like superfamily
LSLKNSLRFVEAWLTLAWVDFQVSFIPYAYWRDELTEGIHPSRGRADATLPLDIRLLISLSESAGRHHWRKMNCLRRCFAQQRILKRRNITTTLHIGVTKSDGLLKAHSWLSCAGRVINDSDDVDSRYAELETETPARLRALLK